MLTRPDWGRIITKKYKKLLLSNGESMSAYIAYNARADMSESDYTVVSNISKKGMHPTEAGAYIAELIQKMLEQRTSGLNLKI